MKQYRCACIGQNMVYIEFVTVDSFKYILGVLQGVHVIIRETTVILTAGHWVQMFREKDGLQEQTKEIWADSTISKVLALWVWGPELDSQNPHKSTRHGVCTSNSSPEETETGGPLGLAGQPGKPLPASRPKKCTPGSPESMSSAWFLG